MSDLQRYFGDKWDAEGATEKLYYTHDLKPESVVFDVGGYKGEWASEIFNRYGCEIEVFEPVKEFQESLAIGFENNPHVTVWPFGLASRNSFSRIYKSGAASSAYRTANAEELCEFRDIATVSLAILIKERMSDVKIDLMAINIEGGEYDLLDCVISSGLAYQTKEIMVQFHPLWPSSYDERNRIRNLLLQTHEEVWCYPFIWEKWRRR